MDLRSIELFGASSISRVVQVYEVWDARGIPWGKYKIKVLQRPDDYVAIPNVAMRSATGAVDGFVGLGRTESEALQDALSQMKAVLNSRTNWTDADFEWSDPRDF